MKYYRDPQLNRSHDGYLGYKLKMDGSQIAVFYEEVQRILYLAPASISRNVYHTKLHDLLKEQKLYLKEFLKLTNFNTIQDGFFSCLSNWFGWRKNRE